MKLAGHLDKSSTETNPMDIGNTNHYKGINLNTNKNRESIPGEIDRHDNIAMVTNPGDRNMQPRSVYWSDFVLRRGNSDEMIQGGSSKKQLIPDWGYDAYSFEDGYQGPEG